MNTETSSSALQDSGGATPLPPDTTNTTAQAGAQDSGGATPLPPDTTNTDDLDKADTTARPSGKRGK